MTDIKIHHRLSSHLEWILDDDGPQTKSLGGLINALEDKAYGVLLFLFAAINVIPAIPGASGILGLPVVFIVAQRAIGRPLSLPNFMMKAPLPQEKFKTTIRWILPKIQAFETLSAPKSPKSVPPSIDYAIDIWVLIIALSVLVPLPFTAMLPAFCICLIALGKIENNPIVMIIGSIIGMAAVFITVSMVFLTLKGVALVLTTPL